MLDRSFSARLKRLFSTQAVVRRIGKDRLKVLDTSKLQQTGFDGNRGLIDRYIGIHNSIYSKYAVGNILNFHTAKVELFTDYEAMDSDPVLASALDIYADESTIKNVNGDLLVINTPDENIKKLLHNLFYDILNIEYNLWAWVRNLCKYGDFFLKLDIREEIGVVNGVPLSCYETQREEGYDPKNPYAVRFRYEGLGVTTHGGKTLEFFEVAHFRLLGDTNFLPYGKSMIESARKIYKVLTLMEDAMMIHRIMRAPDKRVFKVDVGNIPPTEVDAYMEKVMNKVRKIPYVDERTGDYNLKFNLQNMVEDFFLPVRGRDSGTSIDPLSGLNNEGFIDDIEYVKNRMMAALKIPKAFLGYDEGVEGKSTLAAEDIRFARTIERIQNIVVSELTKIAVVHLYCQGYHDESLINFELKLTAPSIVYERQKIDLLNEKTDLASNLIATNLFSERYVYENIFNLSQAEWLAEKEQVIKDKEHQYRLSQIENEGNDPVKTGESRGTAHDIASMHVASKLQGSDEIKDMVDKKLDVTFQRKDKGGRPEAVGTFGSNRDLLGRDLTGMKDILHDLRPSEDGLSQPRYSANTMYKEVFEGLSRKMQRSVNENKTEESSDLLDPQNLLPDDL